MTAITVLGVPSSAGARRTGQELAPAAFRRAGLIDKLLASNMSVTDLGDMTQVTFRPDLRNRKLQNLDMVRDVIEEVSARISRLVPGDAGTLVFGGDCTITIGVLAGLIGRFPRLGLIYFDGDIDLENSTDTPSGILDGMGMANIVGEGAEELVRIGSRVPLMSQEDIVLFGYNAASGWVGSSELQRLEHSSFAQYPVDRVRAGSDSAAKEALHYLDDRVEHILVHFDVDVIDFADFPAADVPHDRGLSFAETMMALRLFVRSPKFVGLVITEFNAERDVDGSLARQLVDEITRIMQEKARAPKDRLQND